jgi:hypothetical protein
MKWRAWLHERRAWLMKRRAWLHERRAWLASGFLIGMHGKRISRTAHRKSQQGLETACLG